MQLFEHIGSDFCEAVIPTLPAQGMDVPKREAEDRVGQNQEFSSSKNCQSQRPMHPKKSC
jgi:hypothetical protein